MLVSACRFILGNYKLRYFWGSRYSKSELSDYPLCESSCIQCLNAQAMCCPASDEWFSPFPVLPHLPAGITLSLSNIRVVDLFRDSEISKFVIGQFNPMREQFGTRLWLFAHVLSEFGPQKSFIETLEKPYRSLSFSEHVCPIIPIKFHVDALQTARLPTAAFRVADNDRLGLSGCVDSLFSGRLFSSIPLMFRCQWNR
jgi:hypothetical protein